MPSIHRALEHRARAVVALLVAALAALGLAACGGGGGGNGGGDTVDAQTLLTSTFTGTHRIDSGKADIRLQIDAEGDPSLQGPIKLTVTGPFQSGGDDALPQFDLALDISAQGQGFKAGLTSAGGRLFVNFGGTAYEVPAAVLSQIEDSFRRARSDSHQALSLESLGLHPASWLKDPTVVGSESIGGVETQHIAGQLDVKALLDDLDGLLATLRSKLPTAAAGAQVPDHIPAKDRQQIEQAIKSTKVDVWTGTDDKTLRKLSVDLTIEPQDSGGPSSAHVAFSVELDDLNEPQTIKAPASSRPLNDLLSQVQGLLGGTLGGSSGFGSSGSGGSSGSSAQVDRYAQCLQDAGGDAAKMQACASLLSE